MNFVLYAIIAFIETNATSGEPSFSKVEQVQIEFHTSEACDVGKDQLISSFDTSKDQKKVAVLVKAECLYLGKPE